MISAISTIDILEILILDKSSRTLFKSVIGTDSASNIFKIPTIYISNEQDEIKRGKLLESKGIGNFFKINKVNKMITELNLLMDSKNYYEKMVSKRDNLFQQNGLRNIKKKINKIFENNEINKLKKS